MGLFILIAGLAVFLGAHTFVSARQARAMAMARLGKMYWLVFAASSLIGVALIVWGFAMYRRTGWIDVWYPPAFLRHVTIGLMWFSTILVLAAYLPGHIKIWTKHPMLAGVKIWAFAHLLSNGDLGSILLFGSFLAWGVIARIAAKKAGEAGAVTAPSGYINDVLVVVIGLALYFALGFYFHPYLIGVPVFTR